jgi:hypothetical protein
MKRAFSMLEVLIASSLFLTTVAGVVSATRTGNAIFEHQRKLTQAVSVGEFAMEELLLRYTSSSDLDITATVNSAGFFTAVTAKTRCIGANLQAATGCTSASITPQSGFSANFIGTVGDGTSTYGITWLVGQPPNLTTERHVILFVSWFEAGVVRSLQLQTYRP